MSKGSASVDPRRPLRLPSSAGLPAERIEDALGHESGPPSSGRCGCPGRTGRTARATLVDHVPLARALMRAARGTRGPESGGEND